MYKVVYLPTARRQLEDAVMYIAVDLCAPDDAMNLADEVAEGNAVQISDLPYTVCHEARNQILPCE